MFFTMSYREIVLKLLKNRGDIICMENHLMNDFKDSENTGENFNDWCELNGIEFLKDDTLSSSHIRLRKRTYNYENN